MISEDVGYAEVSIKSVMYLNSDFVRSSLGSDRKFISFHINLCVCKNHSIVPRNQNVMQRSIGNEAGGLQCKWFNYWQSVLMYNDPFCSFQFVQKYIHSKHDEEFFKLRNDFISFQFLQKIRKKPERRINAFPWAEKISAWVSHHLQYMMILDHNRRIFQAREKPVVIKINSRVASVKQSNQKDFSPCFDDRKKFYFKCLPIIFLFWFLHKQATHKNEI